MGIYHLLSFMSENRYFSVTISGTSGCSKKCKIQYIVHKKALIGYFSAEFCVFESEILKIMRDELFFPSIFSVKIFTRSKGHYDPLFQIVYEFLYFSIILCSTSFPLNYASLCLMFAEAISKAF